MSNQGAKESLTDMTSLLFEQLERLGNSDLNCEQLQEEVKRSKAMADISTRIIQSGELVLRAHMFHDKQLDADGKLPKLLTSNE
jgi:hypothetical protein